MNMVVLIPRSAEDIVLVESTIIADTEAAISESLADIDPNDSEALFERCGLILDEIHAGLL